MLVKILFFPCRATRSARGWQFPIWRCYVLYPPATSPIHTVALSNSEPSATSIFFNIRIIVNSPPATPCPVPAPVFYCGISIYSTYTTFGIYVRWAVWSKIADATNNFCFLKKVAQQR